MSAFGNYAEDEDPYAASDPETLTSRLLAERSLSEGGTDGFGSVGSMSSIAAAVKTVLEEGEHETGNSSSVREATCSFSEAETANLNARATLGGWLLPILVGGQTHHREFFS